jgi:hypothetical protein
MAKAPSLNASIRAFSMGRDTSEFRVPLIPPA